MVDVALDLRKIEGRVTLLLRYHTSLLNQHHAADVAGMFKLVLDLILFNGDKLLSQLDFSSPSDRDKIRQWNKSPPAVAEDCTLQDLFETMVNTHPQNIATDAWDGKFTYSELDRLATKLSHHLRDLGIGPESMVAHCFPKSRWALVSIIAILKAGGCLVGLSPEYPMQRLHAILDDTKARICLTSEDARHALDGLTIDKLIVNARSIESLGASETLGAHVAKATSQNAAYVNFTSGSTGVPKGVVLDHGAICASTIHSVSLFGMNPQSRILQFAAYTFDVHVFDIFVTLISGGCVCIPSDEERSNDLAGFIRRHQVDTLSLTPTVASLLDPKSIPSVKRLVLMGEVVTRGVVDSWTSIPGFHLYNAYGPSECSPLASWTEVLPRSSSATNIGYAMGGNRFWVVDPVNHNRLMPVGCVGELLIEGPTLSRGYLNLPTKTSESFLSNLSWVGCNMGSSLPGPGRVYKTGDLMRYNADGSLDSMGRKDNQVKVNGQRVELSECEFHLNKTKLADCVVVYPTSGWCKGRLVALVAPLNGASRIGHSQEIDLVSAEQLEPAKHVISSLRATLASKVPSYMVPALWASVSAIPLTYTGKTYRLGISRWVNHLDESTYHYITGMSYSGKEAASAEGEEERNIQSVWSKVLGLPTDQIGTNRSFVSLGGDSVAAIRVISLAGLVGIRLVVKELMSGKTIRELATSAQSSVAFDRASDQEIETLTPEFKEALRDVHRSKLSQNASLTKDTTIQIEDVYPCSPVQQGILISQARTGGAYKIHYLAKVTPKYKETTVNVDRLLAAWQAVVDRHPALRTVFVEGNTSERPVEQLVLHNVKADYSHREIPYEEGTDELVCLESSRETLSEFGRLPHRLTIFTNDAGHCYIRLEISHAVTDGGSLTITMRELAMAYDGKLHATPAPTYRNFLSNILSRPLAPSLAYWKDYLQDAESCHFPILVDGRSMSERAQCSVAVDLSQSAAEISAFCKRQEVTSFHVFQTAWALVLRLYLNRNDVSFGYVTSGRDTPVDSIQSTVGPFVSTLSCRVTMDDMTPISTLLHSVRDGTNASLDHQHMSMTDMQQSLNLTGDSLFNTVIGFQTVLAPEDDVERRSLKIDEMRVYDPTEVSSHIFPRLSS